MHAHPLVLLPGHLCDRRMWLSQLDALEGHADAKVIELGARTSVAEMADDVLAEAPDRFALAGFSLGGYVALDILRRAPHRVERIALLDTSARADTSDNQARRARNVERAQGGGWADVVEAFVEAVCGPVARKSPALQDSVRTMMASHSVAHYAAQQQALAARPEARSRLGEIRCPALVAHGRDDAVTLPEWHVEMAAGIPGSVLVPIPDAGHMATMEQPAAVSALLIAWLQMRGPIDG